MHVCISMLEKEGKNIFEFSTSKVWLIRNRDVYLKDEIFRKKAGTPHTYNRGKKVN